MRNRKNGTNEGDKMGIIMWARYMNATLGVEFLTYGCDKSIGQSAQRTSKVTFIAMRAIFSMETGKKQTSTQAAVAYIS